MCQPALSHQTTAVVVFNQPLTKTQFLLRLLAPEVARGAEPGHFVHLNCHPNLTLPRPFSILDADIALGTVDIFYQVVGEGSGWMSRWQPGEKITLLGPIGRGFPKPDAGRRALLIAGGIGYAPLDFYARQLKAQGIETLFLLGMESDDPPFELTPATTSIESDPIIQPLAVARQVFLGIPSRLSSLVAKPGFFQGYVTELAAEMLQALSLEKRQRTDLFVCGPTPMMKAAAEMAARFQLGGYVSLEEHMACGFGGCAGCVAPIRAKDGTWHYRRVCTDGPVFPLQDVGWDNTL
ncbi:MAG: dihydroorotate dehydrogenase electron transfer subunit [Magnetococcales bacterium]|nr:dihydroorotate dehydrogenase electron transfer subunit [Magnetococcales bacterium]